VLSLVSGVIGTSWGLLQATRARAAWIQRAMAF